MNIIQRIKEAPKDINAIRLGICAYSEFAEYINSITSSAIHYWHMDVTDYQYRGKCVMLDRSLDEYEIAYDR